MNKIYMIRNLVNNKVYIGQTFRSLASRWSEHCCVSNGRSCFKLKRAIEKYGKNSFAISCLAVEEDGDKADELEIFYIQQYDSVTSGYNILMGGKQGKGRCSEETRQRMSLARKGKKILRQPKESHLKIITDYKTGNFSYLELSKKYEFSTAGVGRILHRHGVKVAEISPKNHTRKNLENGAIRRARKEDEVLSIF